MAATSRELKAARAAGAREARAHAAKRAREETIKNLQKAGRKAASTLKKSLEGDVGDMAAAGGGIIAGGVAGWYGQQTINNSILFPTGAKAPLNFPILGWVGIPVSILLWFLLPGRKLKLFGASFGLSMTGLSAARHYSK